MANTVCLVRALRFDEQGIKDAVYKAFDSLGFRPVRTPKSVAMKVNLCYYWDYSTGQTTDPRVVSSMIDYIRERWNNEAVIHIVESDASAVRMKHAFKMLGYEELATSKAVHLSNLSAEPSRNANVSVGEHTYTFRIPHTISSADVFISIPKLKTHELVGFSCALKNQFGCNPEPRKFTYHSMLDEVIVALNKVMKPQIILVDGIIALAKHPKRIGLILAGTNPLVVDFVVARIMGFNPLRIGYIRQAAREKIGEAKNIITIGEDINDIKEVFPKQLPSISNRALIGLKRLLYKSYLRLVNDVPL